MRKPLSYKIYQAAGDAVAAHKGQKRKGEATMPYVSHPIAIAISLSNIVDDEDIVIAALLHDTLEDTDFPPEMILQKYGARVLSFVQALTEEKDNKMSKADEKSTWHRRKANMAKKFHDVSWELQLLKFADNLQNLQCLAEDLKRYPYRQVAGSFNAPLGVRAGLIRYNLEHLWKKSKVVEQKCSKWLEQFETLLQEVEAIIVKNGESVVPFQVE